MSEQETTAQLIEIAGQLAAGVAHDFNHTLGIVKNYVYLLSKDIEPNSLDDPRVKEDLQCIFSAVEQGENLARALMLLSRVRDPTPTIFNLNEVIEDAATLMDSLGGTKMEYDLDPDLWPMAADQSQVERLILNLALNARDAMMPEGGTLMLKTFNRVEPVDPELEMEEVVFFTCLSVTDTGHGISPEHLDKIFDPFFTTKPEGSSSGLGLSTAYGITKAAGGHIEVVSKPGETIFTVTFPAGVQA